MGTVTADDVAKFGAAVAAGEYDPAAAGEPAVNLPAPDGGDEWRPNPERIARIKPRALGLYAMGCEKWAESVACPQLRARPAEADAMAQAIAELADAVLPPDDGKVTRGGVIASSLVAIGGVAFMQWTVYQQHMAALAAAEAANDGA